MLEHRATAINRLLVHAPSPISVDLPKPATPPALLDMEVVTFIVGVYDTTTAVTPEYSPAGFIKMKVKRHLGDPLGLTHSGSN